jgi:hypothetical protein
MILFVIGNLAYVYVVFSKNYVEQTLPVATFEKRDEWTENATLWNLTSMPEIEIVENDHDFINATSYYYGNKSIQFSITNSSMIWMQLDGMEPINCSESNCYNNISLRIKRLHPNEKPEKAAIYLFSTITDYFYTNFTDKLSSENIWDNITLSLRTLEWQKSSENANWGYITCLKLEFSWAVPSNITLLVDGLFFHGIYKSIMETEGNSLFLFSLYNPYSLIGAIMQFTVQWVILGGVLYIVPKMAGVKTVWRPLFIASGFIIITHFIRILVFAFTNLLSPDAYWPLSYLGGVPGEWEESFTQIFQTISFSYQIMWYFDKLVWVWTIGLIAILLNSIFSLTWIKGIITSVASFALYLILLILFTPAPPILL